MELCQRLIVVGTSSPNGPGEPFIVTSLMYPILMTEPDGVDAADATVTDETPTQAATPAATATNTPNFRFNPTLPRSKTSRPMRTERAHPPETGLAARRTGTPP